MTAATFQAIDPSTGAPFGDPIKEMDKSEVNALIEKAAAQKDALAKT